MDPVTLGLAQGFARRTARPTVPGLIAAIGDSIINNGTVAASGTSRVSYQPRSILTWACLVSGGKLKNAGTYATGGYTSAQILATHVPQVLALTTRPQFCLVHAGTNDQGTLTVAQSIANLTSIYRQLLAAGITPVLTTYLPKQTLISNLRNAHLEKLSLFALRFARDNGLPVVDWTTPFMDPATGGWVGYSGGTGTYNGDDTHPNAAGAKVAGTAVATALGGLTTALPLCAQSNWMPNAFPPAEVNALFQTDANSNGRPDQIDYAANSANGTFALEAVPDGEGFGNYYKIGVNSGTTGVDCQSDTKAATTGARMLLAFRIKTSGLKAANGKLGVQATTANNDNWLAGLRDFTEDIPAGSVFAQEFTIPSGMSTQSIRLRIVPTTVSGNALSAYTVYIGQVCYLDLDAAGL